MKGRSRKRPPRTKKMKKALVIALAGVVMANSTGIGVMEGYAMETDGSGGGKKADSQEETGGREEGAENQSDSAAAGGSSEENGSEGTESGETGNTEEDSEDTESGETGNTEEDSEDTGSEETGNTEEGSEDMESGGTEDSGEAGGMTEDGSQAEENGQETPGEEGQPEADDNAQAGEDESQEAQENPSGGQGSAEGTQKPSQTPPPAAADTEKVAISYEYDHSLGSVKGPKKADALDSVYFTVTPKENCVIAHVTANGEELEAIRQATASDASQENGKQRYMLLNVEEDVTVEVEFEENEARMLGAEVPQAPEADPKIEYLQMSDGFTVDYENSEKVFEGSSKKPTYYVDIYINENAGDQLDFVLSDVMYNLKVHFGDLTEMPGDYANYELNFINQSGETYVYKADSLAAGPIDMSQKVAEEPEDYPHMTGYDGQLIPMAYSKARCPNEAIQDLFGASSSSKVTLDDMLGIYDKLAEEGYDGAYPLTEYYLDYYGKGKAEHMSDLSDNTLGKIFNAAGNGIYSVSYGGSSFEEKLSELEEKWPYIYVVSNDAARQEFKVQLIEAEPELSAAIYDYWYKKGLGVTVGRKIEDGEVDHKQFDIAIANYLDGNSSIWEDANNMLSSQIYVDDTNQSFKLNAGMGINGPNVGNGYAEYETVFYTAFQLERVITEGTLTINKVDDEGSLIAEKPAVFQIYRMENGVKQYYTGTDWSENQADAADYITVNGTVSIPGLKLNETYYVQETAAPEGYELVETPYQVSMDSENVEINFSNKEQFTIVIHYYLDGTSQKLADSYTSGPYTRGDAYDLTEQIHKLIDGYTWARCDQETFAGVVSDNMIINVYYTKNAADHEDGGSSGGGGGGGGSSPDNGGNGRYQPDEGGPGTTTISQPEVPLAPLPEESQVSVIEPGQTPLAPLPKTGQATPWMTLSALLAGVVLTLTAFGRKREDEGQE